MNNRKFYIHPNLSGRLKSYFIPDTGGVVIYDTPGTQIYNNCFDGIPNNAIRDQHSGAGTFIRYTIVDITHPHSGIS